MACPGAVGMLMSHRYICSLLRYALLQVMPEVSPMIKAVGPDVRPHSPSGKAGPSPAQRLKLALAARKEASLASDTGVALLHLCLDAYMHCANSG